MQTHSLPCLEPVAETSAQAILIIDDDESVIEPLCYGLSQQGYRVLAARNGRQGLKLARTDLPHLVILDLKLPDTSGFDVCQQLSSESQTCSIPVIILSGMEQPDIIRRSRAAGCQYFVRKPYDPNALLVLIRQAIDEARCW